VIQHIDALMLRVAGFSILALAFPQLALARTGDVDRELELLALDDRVGRAVFMDAAGATSMLRLDQETTDGLRLRSVADGTALIEVRFKESGDLIAYRIRLGERVHIRPPQEDRSDGVSVIAVSPEVRTGVKDPSSSAKD
jgi:hypothetical protein